MRTYRKLQSHKNGISTSIAERQKVTYQLKIRTKQLIAWLFQCSDPMWFIKQLCCPSSCLPTRLLVPQVIKLAIDEYSASVEASSTVERTAKHYWYTDQQFLNCFASFLSSTSLK